MNFLMYYEHKPSCSIFKINFVCTIFLQSYDSSSDSKPKNEDALNYIDLQFDDKPRSRRPIQVVDQGGTAYADLDLPRV